MMESFNKFNYLMKGLKEHPDLQKLEKLKYKRFDIGRGTTMSGGSTNRHKGRGILIEFPLI